MPSSVETWKSIMECWKNKFLTIASAFTWKSIQMHLRQSLINDSSKIGHRYCIINRKTFLLLNVPPPYVTSSSILFTPTTLETKRQVAIAAIGIMTEFVRKSKNPKTACQWSSHFQRSVSERRQTSQCDHDHATEHRRFFRLHPSSSSNVDTALSVSAIELVSAAKVQARRTLLPQKFQIPYLQNFWDCNKHQCRSSL